LEDDPEKIAHVLEVFRRIAHDQSTYSKSLDEVTRQFSQVLEEESAREAPSPRGLTNGKQNCVGRASLHSLFPWASNPALFDRIKQVCELTDRQMRQLRNTSILAVDEDGRPIFCDDPQHILPRGKAVIFLFVLGVLSVLAIAVICLASDPGIWLLPYGLGLGMAVGSVTSFVLSRSFQAYPAIKKLNDVRPWLSGATPSPPA
jgi:hypothetical protein